MIQDFAKSHCLEEYFHKKTWKCLCTQVAECKIIYLEGKIRKSLRSNLVFRRGRTSRCPLHSTLGSHLVILRAFYQQLCRWPPLCQPSTQLLGSTSRAPQQHFPSSCDVILVSRDVCSWQPQYCCCSEFPWKEVATNTQITPSFPLIFYPLAACFIYLRGLSNRYYVLRLTSNVLCSVNSNMVKKQEKTTGSLRKGALRIVNWAFWCSKVKLYLL